MLCQLNPFLACAAMGFHLGLDFYLGLQKWKPSSQNLFERIMSSTQCVLPIHVLFYHLLVSKFVTQAKWSFNKLFVFVADDRGSSPGCVLVFSQQVCGCSGAGSRKVDR